MFKLLLIENQFWKQCILYCKVIEWEIYKNKYKKIKWNVFFKNYKRCTQISLILSGWGADKVLMHHKNTFSSI